jgi:hypothetical protein
VFCLLHTLNKTCLQLYEPPTGIIIYSDLTYKEDAKGIILKQFLSQFVFVYEQVQSTSSPIINSFSWIIS